MSNALLSFEDFVSAEGSVILASSEVAGLAAANVAFPAIQKVWRALTPSAFLEIDFGLPREVGVVALAVPQQSRMLARSAALRLRLDLESSGEGRILDRQEEDAIDRTYGYWLPHLEPALTARFLRLDVTTADSDYVEVGRLWAGPAVRPAVNFGYGWSRQWVEEGRSGTIPHSGLRLREPGPRRRRLAFGFDALTAGEADALERGDRLVGRSGQLLFCADPERAGQSSLFCTAHEVLPITQPFMDLFSKSYQIEEDL